MSKMELKALVMLGAASELYNCSEILRDAIESGDGGQFGSEYIEGERELVREAARGLYASIDSLLREVEAWQRTS